MKAKHIFLVVILLLPAIFATAQYPEKVTFGILAGVNAQNLYGQDSNGVRLGNEMILGYHAGANIQIHLAKKFYFQPGLLFSTKGKEKYAFRTITRLAYLELPMNFVYKTQLGKGYFMIGLGPYISYAIMGMEKTKLDGETAHKEDIEFRNSVKADDPLTDIFYKAFDAGVNGFCGYELAGVFAQLNAQLGLVNINPEYEARSDDKSSIKNTGFGFSLGYRF